MRRTQPLRRNIVADAIPNSWSPDQALAIAEFCDRLAYIIWDIYGEEVLARLDEIARQSLDGDQIRQLALPFPDDDIPF